LDQSAGWIFRGQARYESNELQTSLERAASFLKKDIAELERQILWDFKRRATLSGEHSLPANEDIFQWLALLQHHGAPTRLLDFTHSVYVALFFAVDQMRFESQIVCIRASALSRKLPSLWSTDRNLVLKQLLEDEKPPKDVPCAAFKHEPFCLNRRLALRQGCFLVPADVRQSFEANLFSSATGLIEGHGPNLKEITDFLNKTNIFQILIPKAQHSTIRSHLRRMNMTREHLFPGLDGVASSYWQE
jgi:hypothetical protein